MDTLHILGEFDMSHGDHFLNNNELMKDSYSCSLCLEHDNKNWYTCQIVMLGGTATSQHHYLNFVFKSRINSGYCLLDR
jgi:hypothetical protein